MMKRAHICIAIALALLLTLMPVAAYAQTASLTCNNGGVGSGELYDSGGGGACQYTGASHIVGQVVCSYIQIMDDILGKVYCSMQYALKNILQVVLTLYIAIFGVQILLGMTQLNAREIFTRMLKVACVWIFVSNATWGIGLAFNFFVSVASDTVAWVLNPISNASNVSIQETATNSLPIYAYLDNFVATAIFGPLLQANYKVVGFFVIMAHIYPTISGIAIMWFVETLLTVGRILVAFLVSITALAFLIVLSPIFLSFMLFQVTFSFFDNWLRYMICYSLQITVVFAIAVMWIVVTSMFIGFFSDLADLVVSYKQMETKGEMEKAQDALALCKAALTNTSTGPQMGAPDCNNVIPPSKWDEQADYIYYIFYHLLSLLLLAKAFKTMIQDAPKLANNIVSPGLVPALLGGGWGTPGLVAGMAGQNSQDRLAAFRKQAGASMERVADGMMDQYHKTIAKRRGTN